MNNCWLLLLKICCFLVLSSCQYQNEGLQKSNNNIITSNILSAAKVQNGDKIYDYQMRETIRKDLEQIILFLEYSYQRLMNYVVLGVVYEKLENLAEVFVNKNLYYLLFGIEMLGKIFDENANITQVYNEYFSYNILKKLQDPNADSDVYLTYDSPPAEVEINLVKYDSKVEIFSQFKYIFETIKFIFPTIDDKEMYYKNFVQFMKYLQKCQIFAYLQIFEFTTFSNLSIEQEEKLQKIVNVFPYYSEPLRQLLTNREYDSKCYIRKKVFLPADKESIFADHELKLVNEYKKVLEALDDILQNNRTAFSRYMIRSLHYNITEIIEILVLIASGNKYYELLNEKKDLSTDRTIFIYDFYQLVKKLHSIIEAYRKQVLLMAEEKSLKVQEDPDIQNIVIALQDVFEILRTNFPLAKDANETDQGVKNFLNLLKEFKYDMRDSDLIAKTPKLINSDSVQESRFNSVLWNLHSNLKAFNRQFKSDQNEKIDSLTKLHDKAFMLLETAVNIYQVFYENLLNFAFLKRNYKRMQNPPEVFVRQNIYYLEAIVRIFRSTDVSLVDHYNSQLNAIKEQIMNLNKTNWEYLTNYNSTDKIINASDTHDAKMMIISIFSSLFHSIKTVLPTKKDNNIHRNNFLVFFQKVEEYSTEYLKEFEFKTIFGLTSTEEDKLLNQLEQFEDNFWALIVKLIERRKTNKQLEFTMRPVEKSVTQLDLLDSHFHTVMYYVNEFFDTNLKTIYCNVNNNSDYNIYNITRIESQIPRIINLYSNFYYLDDMILVKYFMLDEIKNVYITIENIKASLSNCQISKFSLPEMQKKVEIQIIHYIQIICKLYSNVFSSQNDNKMNINLFRNMLKFVNNSIHRLPSEYLTNFGDIEEKTKFKNSLQDFVIHFNAYKETGEDDEARSLKDFKSIVQALDEFFLIHYDTVMCHFNKNENQDINSFVNSTMSYFALGCEYYTSLYEESVLNKNRKYLITNLREVTKLLHNIVDEFPESFYSCYIDDRQHFLQINVKSKVAYLFRNIVRSIKNNIPSQNTNSIQINNILNMMHGFREFKNVLNFLKVDDLEQQKVLRDLLMKIDFVLRNR